jgi:hypothetical protein
MLSPLEKWNPLTAPALSALIDYFNNLLQTTWPVTAAGFQLFFMLDALLVLSLMEHFFPEKQDDPRFTGLLRPIEFLVLTVYGYFMKYQDRGYISPVMSYFSSLQDIAGIIPLLRPVKNISDVQKCAVLNRQVEAAVALHRPDRRMSLADAVESYEDSTVQLLDVVHESAHPTLYQALVGNLRSLRATEQALSIQSPNIMMQYVYTFLCAWFGIWFPITLWATVGFQTTLFLYPSFMYVLWGPSIHRYWLGNPWDDRRVYRESDHTEWPVLFKNKIHRGLMTNK